MSIGKLLFPAPIDPGLNCAGGFALSGEFPFQHRLSGVPELRQRVRSVRAAPFLHRLTGIPNCVSVFAPDGRRVFR